MSFSYKTVDAVPATPCCSHLVGYYKIRPEILIVGSRRGGGGTHPFNPTASTVSIHTVLIMYVNKLSCRHAPGCPWHLEVKWFAAKWLKVMPKSGKSLLKGRDWRRLGKTKPNNYQQTPFAVKLHVWKTWVLSYPRVGTIAVQFQAILMLCLFLIRVFPCQIVCSSKGTVTSLKTH